MVPEDTRVDSDHESRPTPFSLTRNQNKYIELIDLTTETLQEEQLLTKKTTTRNLASRNMQ